jgi:hypothetical protein
MRTLFRKFAILIAAYALALQPVVAAMSAAPAHAATAFCSSGSGGDTPGPAGPHNHGNDECCLAMGCNAPAGGAPATLFSIASVFNVAAAPRIVAKPAPRIAFFSGWQHAARAPPV